MYSTSTELLKTRLNKLFEFITNNNNHQSDKSSDKLLISNHLKAVSGSLYSIESFDFT